MGPAGQKERGEDRRTRQKPLFCGRLGSRSPVERKEKYNLLSAYCASVDYFLEAATVPGRACTTEEKGGLEYGPSFIESFIQQRFIERLLCARHS